MFKYTKAEVITLAKQNGFLVNNTEKVLRLSAILNHLIKTRHGQCLALKGGTAINLFLLDLPRLSVDIDFDFALNCSNEKLPAIREEIKEDLCSFMENEGYSLTAKSKFAKALDSFVFSYFTLSGSRDLLKVEINYADRLHVLPTLTDEKTIALGEVVSTRRLSNDELIASKINALIVRTTPRDIYDVYNLFNAGLADSSLIKKIALFYVALGSEVPVDFEKLFNDCLAKIDSITYNKLRGTLIPVLHKEEKINIDEFKTFVANRLKNLFLLDENEKKFFEQFNSGLFEQKLLFGDLIQTDLKYHPMVLWKTVFRVMEGIRKEAVRNGTAGMSLEEINAEIEAVRNGK